MSSSKSYRELHEKVLARPEVEKRLAALRSETLAEIGRFSLRWTSDCFQADLSG